MASSEPTNTKSHEELEHQFQHPQLSLPQDEWFGSPLCFYQGFWCPTELLFEEVVTLQNHFQAHDTDVILASLPKTGTTWLKALLYTIINRSDLSNITQHTFPSKNPHELVPFLDFMIYKFNKQSDLDNIPAPRLFSIHLPYATLPESIKTTNCRIVYICRNPLDNFVSYCQFWLQFNIYKGDTDEKKLMKKYVEKYCNGIFPLGPYEDHLLGYWKESMENSKKVLFLEYEGLKKEPKVQLKRLAEFLGCPFSAEEEEGKVVDEIIELCSFKSLKEMEVNKNGKFLYWFENKALFRKGVVGDWTNYLTPTMIKYFDKMQDKLLQAGFCSKYYQPNP